MDTGAPRLRQALLALAALSVVATAAELILLEHWSGLAQLVPWLGLSLVSITIAAVWLRPGRRVLIGARVVALVTVACASYGFVEHLLANQGFASELHPEWGTARLLGAGLTGKIPVLASLAVALSGLLLAAATIQHPGLKLPDATDVKQEVRAA